LAKLKPVASLPTSEFPLEIPRSQSRNIQYTTTLPKIAETTQILEKGRLKQ
jgi:hypothetical protein